MTTIDLKTEHPDLDTVIALAKKGPLLLLTSDGKEFFMSEADDFEREVESLRSSVAFQRFLDERSACKVRVPLSDIEAELNEGAE